MAPEKISRRICFVSLGLTSHGEPLADPDVASLAQTLGRPVLHSRLSKRDHVHDLLQHNARVACIHGRKIAGVVIQQHLLDGFAKLLESSIIQYQAECSSAALSNRVCFQEGWDTLAATPVVRRRS